MQTLSQVIPNPPPRIEGSVREKKMREIFFGEEGERKNSAKGAPPFIPGVFSFQKKKKDIFKETRGFSSLSCCITHTHKHTQAHTDAYKKPPVFGFTKVEPGRKYSNGLFLCVVVLVSGEENTDKQRKSSFRHLKIHLGLCQVMENEAACISFSPLLTPQGKKVERKI